MLRVAEAAHRTDTGRQREANEDSFFARAPVFAVADGMGGAQAGEVASRLAVEAFEPELDASLAAEQYLSETAQRANREIFDLASGDTSRSGMGTTLTAALVGDGEVSFGHVGDSRAYRLRDGELSQLTNDHSLVEELRRQGKLTADQAAEHPQRSVITRALGPEPQVPVDTMTVPARDDDVFILCSDGLTTMLGDAELESIVRGAPDLDAAGRELVRAANDRGGRDNITVVLFRVEEVAVAGSPQAEEATLIGTTAEAEGLTADAVREGVEAQPAEAQGRGGMPKPIAVPSGRAQRRGPWPGRIARTLALLLIIGGVCFGAYYGARQIWFIGSDESGRVALYRGLPYDLPFGVELYSESFSIPVTVDSLPEDRRDAATNHELRSRADATDLIEDLQRAALEDTGTAQGTGNGGNGGGGSGANGGGSGSGGGSSGGGSAGGASGGNGGNSPGAGGGQGG